MQRIVDDSAAEAVGKPDGTRVAMLTNDHNLKTLAWALAAMWTLLVGSSLAWNVIREHRETLEAARVQARVGHQKDVSYRQWSAGHGGTYAPATEETPPNPHLDDVPEKDLETPSGRALTLVNPAYMTRQVHELEERESMLRGHLTSLKPIRPQNAPDPWEREALEAFERGGLEVSSVELIDGREYMRLMRPLMVHEACLTCHAQQGYEEGQVRGGLSISVPMDPLWQRYWANVGQLCLGHGMLWLVGGGALWGWTRRLQRSEDERQRAEGELRESEERYRDLAERLPVGISHTSLDGSVLYHNPYIQSMYGYAPEELSGLRVEDIYVHREDREDLLRNLNAELQTCG